LEIDMVAAAIAGAAVVGAVGSSVASSNAADAQKDAANTASNTQLQMYNTTRQDQAPWRAAGGAAVNALGQFYGLPGYAGSPGASSSSPTSTPAYRMGPSGEVYENAAAVASTPTNTDTNSSVTPPDYNAILSNLPGYQFQQQQGNQAVQRNLAAAGLLQSGAAGKALTQYGQGVASNYATQYVNGLQSLAGLGQTSVANTGAVGANTANQIGANQIYGGNAQASGYVGQANAFNSGLSGIVGSYGYANQNAQPNYNNGSYASVMNNGNFGGANSYGSGYTLEDYGVGP
jgi:hypothetical protein